MRIKNTFAVLLIFITGVISAQKQDNDVIRLKDGSVIKGTIVHPTADSIIAIKTGDGNVFVYKKKEVETTVVLNREKQNNNLWLGFNFEPQFQNVFKSWREQQAYVLNTYRGTMQLPGRGGFQMGFVLAYLPNGYAGFQTGFQYHLYQSREILSRPFNGTTEYQISSNSYSNIEIPVLVNIHGPGNRLRFYSVDGISAGITLAGNHTLAYTATGYPTVDSSFTTHLDSTTAIYCTLMVSAGLQIKPRNDMLINVAATFRLSAGGILGATNPFYVPNHYPFYPYSIGISVELLFKAPSKNKNHYNNHVMLQDDGGQTIPDGNKIKHANWLDAILVSSQGDTIKGRVRKSDDYAVSSGPFTSGKLILARADETEERYAPEQFKELYIPQESSWYRKYITIKDEVSDAVKIYRIVEDGKCRLLTGLTTNDLPSDITSDGLGKFYYYYKNKLTSANFKITSVKNPEFMSRFKQYYADCPELIQKVESKKISVTDISDIVSEFNKCIGRY